MALAEHDVTTPLRPKRIAYLCCEGTASWSAERRPDAFEHDRSLAIFVPAFAAHDIVLEEVVWNAPDTDWSRYDAALIGSVWDYSYSPAVFLETIERIAGLVPLANDFATVAWNLDKTYLRDLDARGAPSIPTLWCDRLVDAELEDMHRRLGSAKLVIKPVVGAGGHDQYMSVDGVAPPADHPIRTVKVMVQPLLENVRTEGEFSLIFFDGRFSHALRKTPAPTEYRVQSIYDGKMHAMTPSREDLEAGEAIIAALPHRPVYARIDMVRRDDGQLALMEAELIEPYLFPDFDDSKGDRFARATLDWLHRETKSLQVANN